jgi:diacylglycerol kinase family enzyme
MIAVASNIRHYGLMSISPSAYLDDGQMDLWLFTGSTLADAFRALFDILAEKHVNSDQARCIPFHKVTIESDTPFSIQMDGEPMLGAQKVSLEVLPQKLQVLMPRETREQLCKPHAQG